MNNFCTVCEKELTPTYPPINRDAPIHEDCFMRFFHEVNDRVDMVLKKEERAK